MHRTQNGPRNRATDNEGGEIELRLRSNVSFDEMNAMAARGVTFSLAGLLERFGAAQRDIDTVAAFAERAGLVLAAVDAVGRCVRLRGTATALARSFGVRLRAATIDGRACRVRIGAPSIPAPLKGIVLGVEALDGLPEARVYFERPPRSVDRRRLMRT